MHTDFPISINTGTELRPRFIDEMWTEEMSPSPKIGRFNAAIFDLDGTLAESNDFHALAWQETLHEFGIHASFEKIRRLIDAGTDDLLQSFGPAKESELGRTIELARRERFAKKHLPYIRQTPGASSLLQFLHASGVRLALASSSPISDVEAILKQIHLYEYFEQDLILTKFAQKSRSKNGQMTAAKSGVASLQLALQRVELDTSKAVVVGDSPYDVMNAARFGARSFALRCSGWPDLSLSQATRIFDDPNDLLLALKRSPRGAALGSLDLRRQNFM